jgi:hypothetical protein
MKTKYDNCCKCNGPMEGGSMFTEGGERFCFCRPCSEILNRCNPNSGFRVFSFLKTVEHLPLTLLEKADLEKRVITYREAKDEAK